MSDLVRLIQGSAHHLPSVADGSVQCIVTSPPYFALRSYAGEQQVEWPAVEYAPMVGLPPITIPAMKAALGLEPTIEAYVGHLMLCLREWRRVLRADGTLWVNLGDSFSTGSGGNGPISPKQMSNKGAMMEPQGVRSGLPPKNLMMIPARFALAAQADGWYVRSDIIWSKENCMPESVTDRPTKSHEYLYLLSKSPVYFYDSEAIKEESTDPEYRTAGKVRPSLDAHFVEDATKGRTKAGLSNQPGGRLTRNKRTVWIINTSPYPDAHFATFPEKLPETCILAGTSERGCCPQCGAPWERVTNTERKGDSIASPAKLDDLARNGVIKGGTTNRRLGPNVADIHETIAWQPTCKCDAGEPVACTVLDPFSGSGTTGRVAVRLGRRYIGVDISKEYLEQLAPERLKVQMELLGTR